MRTLIITATILVPVAASAGGYLVPSMSPRDLGLSQSAVANEEGAEAVALNTAALAGQEGLDIGLSAGLLSNRTDWSAPAGSESMSQANYPPGVAISYGQRLAHDQAWGIGVGFGTPAGGSIAWPDGWAGREAIQSVKQQVFAFGAGAAFQLLPNVKFGASYVRFQATEEIHQSINFMDHFASAALGLSGGGNSFGLAGQFTIPTMPLAFGVTYVHSANLDLTGHAHFTDVPAGFQDQLHDQAVSHNVLIPDVLTIGAAYEAMPNLTIMAGYEFEHWSDYETDTFVGADPIMEADGTSTHFTVVVPRNYNNAHVLRLGGEYKNVPFLPELTARAGIQRSISEQPAETLSPSLTDASSWGLAIGAGFNVMSNLRVDVGYQHVFFDEVTASGPEAFPGSYNTAVDLLSLGINWRTDLGLSGSHQ
jgi:long-subunit fatty acid transport protein